MIAFVFVAHSETSPISPSCLQKCTPSHCPVCRGGYRKEKIKKLHVETALIGRDEISRVSSPSAITEYLQMVAMISGEGVPDIEVEKVSVRVDEWVASLPQNLKLQVSHRFFFCFRVCFLVRTFDHILFRDSRVVGTQLEDEGSLGFECSMLTKSRSSSRSRSALRWARSNVRENCSRNSRRPEWNALRPKESLTGYWTMFDKQSWSRMVYCNQTTKRTSMYLDTSPWLLINLFS